MKQTFNFLVWRIVPAALILSIFVCGCKKSTKPYSKFGSIAVSSLPSGATIFLDNDSSGFITPDTITNVSSGNHTLKLSLKAFFDTTFSVVVSSNTMTSVYIELDTVITQILLYDDFDDAFDPWWWPYLFNWTLDEGWELRYDYDPWYDIIIVNLTLDSGKSGYIYYNDSLDLTQSYWKECFLRFEFSGYGEKKTIASRIDSDSLSPVWIVPLNSFIGKKFQLWFWGSDDPNRDNNPTIDNVVVIGRRKAF